LFSLWTGLSYRQASCELKCVNGSVWSCQQQHKQPVQAETRAGWWSERGERRTTDQKAVRWRLLYVWGRWFMREELMKGREH